MPGRNIRKVYAADSFYHIYNRGVNKQDIFLDEQDYSFFLGLFKRYLSSAPAHDKKGRQYSWFRKEIELLTFCLMPNHFHLLVHQHEPEGMTHLLRAVMSSYGMYFNQKYKRVGPLFQNNFRASLIDRDDYLMHISRYIHLNPDEYDTWSFSSLPYYLGKRQAEWISPGKALQQFGSVEQYSQFLRDYEGHRAMLKELKYILADG